MLPLRAGEEYLNEKAGRLETGGGKISPPFFPYRGAVLGGQRMKQPTLGLSSGGSLLLSENCRGEGGNGLDTPAEV